MARFCTVTDCGRVVVGTGRARLRVACKIGLGVTAGTVMVLACVWLVHGTPASAGQTGEVARAADDAQLVPPEVAGFLAGVERRHRDSLATLTRLARPLLDRVKEPSAIRDSLTKQQVVVASARSNAATATLVREIAEIAVREYEEGIFKQDEATAQGDVVLAEGELGRATDRNEFAKQHAGEFRAKAKVILDEAAFKMLADVIGAELEQKRAAHAVERVQAKLKRLREYEKPRRIKELRRDVEKARSAELAGKGALTLEQAKENRILAQTNRPGLSERERQLLATLAQCGQLELKLAAYVKTMASGRDTGEKTRKTIELGAHELEILVARAGDAAGEIEATELKKSVDREASRFLAVEQPSGAAGTQPGPDRKAVLPAEIGAFVTQIMTDLKAIQARMKGIAEPIFASIQAQAARVDDPIAQASVIQVARADLAVATLDREIAETALAEYEQLVAKDEGAAAQGAIKLAELDLARAKELNQLAQERARDTDEAWKKTPKKAVDDREFRERALALSAKLEETKTRLALEQARSKLTIWTEFERPKREKELKREFERARAGESVKQAVLLQQEAKLKKMQERGTKPELTPLERRLLAQLEGAVRLDDSIRGELNALSSLGKPDGARRRALEDRVNQLDVLIGEAEEEASEGSRKSLLKELLRAGALHPASNG